MSMTIDRVGLIDPIQAGGKTGRTTRSGGVPQTDSVRISAQAVERAEFYRVRDLASAAPDVRMDRIEEVKAKLNDPSYIDGKVIEATADRIIDALFG